MKWQVMDVTDMKYCDGTFDLVIDKGTMDALSCPGGSSIRKMINECLRILKPGGFYVVISIYDDREDYFRSYKEHFRLSKYEVKEWHFYVA